MVNSIRLLISYLSVMYLKVSFEEILPIVCAGKIKPVFHVFARESRFGMILFYKTKSYKKSKSLYVLAISKRYKSRSDVNDLKVHSHTEESYISCGVCHGSLLEIVNKYGIPKRQ